jgi:hypothetical protein
MNIDQAINRFEYLKDDLEHELEREPNKYVKRDISLDIEAIDKLISCGKWIVEGGRKIV